VVGGLFCLFLLAVFLIIVSWDFSYEAQIVLFASVAFIIAITITAALIRWRKWRTAGATLVMAVLPVWWVIAAVLPNPERDQRIYGRFLQISLPSDAHGFSWRKSSSDQFGDHDGTINFSASAESLQRLGSAPLFGEYDWKELPDGRFKVDYSGTGRRGKGTINPDKGTFSLHYSTF